MVRYVALKGLYDVEKTIGCGGFAKVKLATHLATGEKVAIKIMDKSRLGDDLHRVKLELDALKRLSHPHICRLYEVLETDTNVFLIMEYCSGGELFDHIVERNRLDEAESRAFFRQIVSAVVYLHGLGYAHRDLKPENVLLDGKRSLKLIDFGLCAKPEGGMSSQLSTSCGSPTYAAPELVTGRKYLGSEVDVWSLGVLLYALLCGSLPFDDQAIDNLYKKILKGKYYEPSFLSGATRDFIRSMLQVEPLNRITSKELLNHPWITAAGSLQPVKFEYNTTGTEYDIDCLELMADYHNVSMQIVRKSLDRRKYDYNTATYLLLQSRKERGMPLGLQPSARKVPLHYSRQKKNVPNGATGGVPSQLKRKREEGDEKAPRKVKLGAKIDRKENVELLAINVKTPKIIVPLKRARSPTFETESSPIPSAKKMAVLSTKAPGNVTPRTPERNGKLGVPDTPGSARRMLGTIERSLNRVRNALTPKKGSEQISNPTILASKDLCNVSTTQCTDPEYVIHKLSAALENKGMLCHRKGFILRGKMEPDAQRRLGGCSFELEICYLPSLGAERAPASTTMTVQRNHVGIRRKRLKGDSWCYKKVCEEVLALTATEEFKQANVKI